jgi:NAD+ synthase
VNQVGGQDELVFDGASFVLDGDCGLRAQLPSFEESLVVTRWHRRADDAWACDDSVKTPPEDGMEPIYRTLVLGLRDYVNKNGFPGVVIGLSGGIDSALSAAVAVDALGAERVHCVMMPSPYTSQDSLEDASEAAKLLGVKLDEIRIEPAMAAFEAMLAPIFDAMDPDITEENIQARSRGMTLMALSNKLGHMVLSTGKGRLQDQRLRALALAQPGGAQGRTRPGRPGDPRAHPHQAALGRAQARPDRPGQPAAL